MRTLVLDVYKRQLKEDCARRVIDHYGYKRTAFVLANTLQEHSYDGRYHPTNIQWSRSIYIPVSYTHLKYRNICNFRNIFVRIDPSVFLCG